MTKNADANIATLGIAMPIPADAGLNPDDKEMQDP
jgi:hypothetical protein